MFLILYSHGNLGGLGAQRKNGIGFQLVGQLGPAAAVCCMDLGLLLAIPEFPWVQHQLLISSIGQ